MVSSVLLESVACGSKVLAISNCSSATRPNERLAIAGVPDSPKRWTALYQ